MRRQSVVVWTVLHTFKYSGRASRTEFWSWILVTLGVQAGALVIGSAIGGGDPDATVGFIALITLVMIPTTVAVLVRRLHDVGQAGWWALMAPLPILGLILLVWLVLAGDRAANKFGAVPTYMVVVKTRRSVHHASLPTQETDSTENDQPSQANDMILREQDLPERPEPRSSFSAFRNPVATGLLGLLVGVLLAGGVATMISRASDSKGSYSTAFEIMQKLNAAGIGCEPQDSGRDAGFSFISCKTSDGGSYGIQAYPDGKWGSDCGQFPHAEQVVAANGWSVEAVKWTPTDVPAFPALAPPEAIQDALGGQILSHDEFCKALGH